MSRAALNVREMLLQLGTPPFTATMVIPSVWMTPGTTDPDSPSVIEIIRAIQRGLRKLGYTNVEVLGVLDSFTGAALNQVASPRWMEKAWVQIMDDVLSSMKNPERKAHHIAASMSGMGSYFEYEGFPPGPLPGIVVGTPPGPLGLGITIIDSGVELEWGMGIHDKSNMVPIPKTSGVTYTVFKGLQRQINRLGGRVGEDGILGKGTLAGLRRVANALPANSPARARTAGIGDTMGLAANAATLVTLLTQEANNRGIATTANQGPTRTTASSETTSGPVTHAQATASMGAGGALKKYLPYLLLAGGVAWFASKKNKRKKKSRA